MVDEIVLLKRPDQIATKVLQPNVSVALLHGWDLHAVECDQPTGHHNPVKFAHHEIESGKELLVVADIAHVLLRVRV